MQFKNLLTHWRYSSAGELAHLVWHKFNEVRVAQVAGSLTYTTLLSVVPLVTVVVAVMSQFSEFAKLSASMKMFLLDNLLPDRAGKVITTYALQFSEKASNLTLVGTLALFVTSVMLLHTIEHTFNAIWGVTRQRTWWVRIPMYWLALTLGPLFFAASVAMTTQIISASLGGVSSLAWLQGVLLRVLPALLLSIFFVYIFHAVPNRKLMLRYSLIGGVFAAIGVLTVQRLFGFYLASLPSVTLIYGAFSVVPIFLIWLYFSWCVVLVGAVLAAVLPEFSERGERLPDTPAGRVHAALRLAEILARAQMNAKALPLSTIAKRCGISAPAAEKMLYELRAARWCVRTEGDEWILCVAADTLRLNDFIMRLAVGHHVHNGRHRRRDQAMIDEIFERISSALDTPITDLLIEQDGVESQTEAKKVEK